MVTDLYRQSASLSIKVYQPDLDGTTHGCLASVNPLAMEYNKPSMTGRVGSSRVEGNNVPLSTHSSQWSRASQSTTTPRSFTARKDQLGKHTPIPLDNTLTSISTEDRYSPLWSPPYTAPPASCGTTSSMWSPPFSPGAIGEERQTSFQRQNFHQPHGRNSTKLRGGPKHGLPNTNKENNVVDVNRIRRGLDVRTTV